MKTEAKGGAPCGIGQNPGPTHEDMLYQCTNPTGSSVTREEVQKLVENMQIKTDGPFRVMHGPTAKPGPTMGDIEYQTYKSLEPVL